MSMETNLQGRVNNTALPLANGLLPLFEAVSNSIHSIEDAALPMENGNISVHIIRDTEGQYPLDTGHKKPGPIVKGNIVGFKIFDNGIGFTDANMLSFKILDSDYKRAKGGRGVGRLLWLKAFKKVTVTSVFDANNGQKINALKLRTFSFDVIGDVYDEKLTDASTSERRTCVYLDDFDNKYRDASLKTAQSIATSLLEHCLWYFVRPGGAPNIVVVDGEEIIDLNKVRDDFMLSSAVFESVEIKGSLFELMHVKMRAHSQRTHMIAFCAANRLVKEESIRGRIAGLFGGLSDEQSGNFLYECYVSSPFLDDKVRSERTDFNIDDELPEMLSAEISQKDIRDCVLAKASEYLEEYLNDSKKRARERIDSFVAAKAPRYRPLLHRMPESSLLNIDPSSSDREIEAQLHRQYADMETRLFADSHEIVSLGKSFGKEEYLRRVETHLAIVNDMKRSDLINYVVHRRVVLDFLDEAIRKDSDGNYQGEDVIHNLIMPMRKESGQVRLDSCNLWLIDERLAFHDYLASDLPLSSMPITDCTEDIRPDILVLNVCDNPILVSEGEQLPLASIDIVELKKPMRKDISDKDDKDPIKQALRYLDKVRHGNVRTKSGRPIPNSESIPDHCYVICDISDAFKTILRDWDARLTSDSLGYFFYNQNYNAYVEVMSFDRLVNIAKQRNMALFEKLGLSTL